MELNLDCNLGAGMLQLVNLENLTKSDPFRVVCWYILPLFHPLLETRCIRIDVFSVTGLSLPIPSIHMEGLWQLSKKQKSSSEIYEDDF